MKTKPEVRKKLPKAFKRKWIAALRSSKYKQGYGKLKQKELIHLEGNEEIMTYCCLGVACEVVGAKINMKINPGLILDSRHIQGITKIPKLLYGDTSDNNIVHKLTEMNDRKQWSFKRIATWIDKHL